MIIRRLLTLAASIALGAAVAAPGAVSANDDVMMLSKNPNNWAMWGRTYDGTRYSPLAQIDTGNVGDLQVAWTFSTGVIGNVNTWTHNGKQYDGVPLEEPFSVCRSTIDHPHPPCPWPWCPPPPCPWPWCPPPPPPCTIINCPENNFTVWDKVVDTNTGEELYSFKTPSGIIGNVNTWIHDGKQYVGTLSGIGGRAGIGMGRYRHGRGLEGDTDGLGAVGAYRGPPALGGLLTLFALPG